VANDPDDNIDIVLKMIQLGPKDSESRSSHQKMIEKEIKVGMIVAKECNYIFEWGDFFCIKMEYCINGDIEESLSKGRIFSEIVSFSYLYMYTCYRCVLLTFFI
jgi:hypothetical protein